MTLFDPIWLYIWSYITPYDLEKTCLIYLVDVTEATYITMFGHIYMTVYEMRNDIWYDISPK